MRYQTGLGPLGNPPPILADFPQYVEPLPCDRRFLATPLVNEEGGSLRVRCWRYCYNVRGIVEMENRLEARATAAVVVHPWGVDDDHGLVTPEPAGCAFFCTVEKNRIAHRHLREVVSPFLRRLRPHLGVIGYSLPGVEDWLRRMMYPSICSPPGRQDAARGEQLLAEMRRSLECRGEPLPPELELDPAAPVSGYFEQTPSTDAGVARNGPHFWNLPMPASAALERGPNDLAFYDAEGYPKVRDHLQSAGIRHVLVLGYCTDMCVIGTTCGYRNFNKDFNVFVVGDATLATFPASTTPRFKTQAALVDAALTQMVTQVNWVRSGPDASPR